MDFGRVITAMATPLNEDYSLDLPGAQRLARHLLENGSDALVVAGTTGESPTLSPEEKLRLFAAVRETTQSAGKKFIAGAGSNNTAASVELAKKAEALGADGILAVVPYYNKPPQEGLYRHFRAIAEAVSVPVILYNVPGRTVTDLLPETISRLAEIPNIGGVKEASGDTRRAARIRESTPADFLIYSGEDAVTLPLLSVGACGVISVASHLIGDELQEMIAAWEKGKTADALELHLRYDCVFRDLFRTANPIPVKYCLNRIGLPAGPCRLPLIEADLELRIVLDDMLRKIGLL